MILTGRLTGDASVNQVKDDRQVVNFSIAINDRFKTKGGEQREVTTYVECAYWQSVKAAEWLKKGTVVELYGRIGVNAYVNQQGDAVGKLTCHTKEVKVLAFPAKREGGEAVPAAVKGGGKASGNNETKDTEDLPF